MSGIKRLYWEEIEKMNDEDTPDIEELKEFVNPDEYPSDLAEEVQLEEAKKMMSDTYNNTAELLADQIVKLAHAEVQLEEAKKIIEELIYCSAISQITPEAARGIRFLKILGELKND